jgi:hypothetical protein
MRNAKMLLAMERNQFGIRRARERSFCCGPGGGLMFLARRKASA